MKDQTHNEGKLGSLDIKIEQNMIDDLKKMSENSGLSQEDIIVIALKRFRSSHADYMGIDLDFP